MNNDDAVFEKIREALAGNESARNMLLVAANDKYSGMIGAHAARYWYMKAIEDGAQMPLNPDEMGPFALHVLFDLAAIERNPTFRNKALSVLGSSTSAWQLQLAAANYLYQLDSDRGLYEKRLTDLEVELEKGRIEYIGSEAPSQTYYSKEEARKELIACLHEARGQSQDDSLHIPTQNERAFRFNPNTRSDPFRTP